MLTTRRAVVFFRAAAPTAANLSNDMAAIDATAKLLRDLEDPAKYARNERVSVFMPHTRDFPGYTLPNGQKILPRRVKVGEAELREIANNVNRLYSRDGHLVLLTIGHRKGGATPETQQPPCVGYGRNYKAELVQRPNGPALRLTHTEFIDRRHEAEAAKYPGRSPEYDPDEKTFGAVALLTRDPHLTSGTVHYDAGSGRVLYAMGAPMGQEAMPGAGMPTGGDMAMGPEDDVQYAAFCGDMRKYAKAAAFMKKYQAEAMGPMNGQPPGPGPAPEPMPYQKNDVIEAGLASLTARDQHRRDANAATAAQLVESNSRRLLDPLVDVVRFTYEKELSTLIGLPSDEDRVAHVHYMRDNYAELPTGQMKPTLPGPAPSQSGTPDAFREPGNYKQVMAYVRAHPGISYERAEQMVTAGTAN